MKTIPDLNKLAKEVFQINKGVVDEKTGESEYIPVVLLCDALKILEEKDNGARVLQKDIKVE